jgi:hypothetical protein
MSGFADGLRAGESGAALMKQEEGRLMQDVRVVVDGFEG